jgi:hypothetical protein
MIVVIRTFEAYAPNGIAAEASATPEEFAATIYLLELILDFTKNGFPRDWVTSVVAFLS